jgi:uncharacterized membrane protein
MLINRFILGAIGAAIGLVVAMYLITVDGSKIIIFGGLFVLLVSAVIMLPYRGAPDSFEI